MKRNRLRGGEDFSSPPRVSGVMSTVCVVLLLVGCCLFCGGLGLLGDELDVLHHVGSLVGLLAGLLVDEVVGLEVGVYAYRRALLEALDRDLNVLAVAFCEHREADGDGLAVCALVAHHHEGDGSAVEALGVGCEVAFEGEVVVDGLVVLFTFLGEFDVLDDELGTVDGLAGVLVDEVGVAGEGGDAHGCAFLEAFDVEVALGVGEDDQGDCDGVAVLALVADDGDAGALSGLGYVGVCAEVTCDYEVVVLGVDFLFHTVLNLSVYKND